MSYEMDNHYVGEGSSFDDDMLFVESVVNFHTRGNENDVDTLYFYYMATLRAYWNKVEALYALTEEDAYKSVNFNAEGYEKFFKYVLSKLSSYREDHYYDLAIITENYNRNHMLDVNTITNMFDRMANILCFTEPRGNIFYFIPDITENEISHLMANIYPIVNDTGAFSVNGYLYAYVNNVYLIGIPSNTSSFDKIEGCPARFESHDVQHLYLQYKFGRLDDYIVSRNRKLYYHILSDNNLSKNKKEYLLYAMWFSVHEKYNYSPYEKLPRQSWELLFSHDWLDVKEEDYEEMSKYQSGLKKVSVSDYSKDKRRKLLSIINYYNAYFVEYFSNQKESEDEE